MLDHDLGWFNLQNEYDLYKTLRKKGEEIESIEEDITTLPPLTNFWKLSVSC